MTTENKKTLWSSSTTFWPSLAMNISTWRSIDNRSYLDAIVIYNNYVIPDYSDEIIKKGCISSVDIIKNSEHQYTSYASFNNNETILSGTGLSFVVENDQNTLIANEILIQNGGTNDDLFGRSVDLSDSRQSLFDKDKEDESENMKEWQSFQTIEIHGWHWSLGRLLG